MSAIDCVTAVLAIPAVEEDGQVRDARPGEALLDDYVQRLERKFQDMLQRAEGRPSDLDRIWSELLGEPVRVNDAVFGAYEKKGLVYPAILFDPVRISSRSGSELAQTISRRFREDAIRSRLAELIGTRLGVDWVSIFTTYGAIT